MEKKAKFSLIIAACAVAAIILVLLLSYFYARKGLQQEREAFARIEKEQMLDELNRLQSEYTVQTDKLRGGMSAEVGTAIGGDSLIQQLITEQTRVQRLREELAAVKSDNYKQITKLQGEVGTLRKILRSYVVQIDSLQQTNERLRAENKAVQAGYRRVEAEASKLKGEKQELNDRVSLAAKLNAANIRMGTLDKKGKETRRIDRIRTLRLDFTITKNVTAAVGPKPVYARIMMPNGELLGNDGSSFSFEGKQIVSSASKTIEYNGEDFPVTLYRNISEALPAGTYRVYIFADGNIIGQSSFPLQ